MENIAGNLYDDIKNENELETDYSKPSVFDQLRNFSSNGISSIVKIESSAEKIVEDGPTTQKSSPPTNQTNSALVQRNLELHLSKDAQEKIQDILDDVNKLSDKEKLLLYLKLPTKTGMQEGDGQPIPLSNTRQEQTQAFQWIRSHLEECDSSYTLPKHEVYDDYKAYCESLASSRTLSAPDFGKIIKCVFPKVKARRLGTRGNSKYCYSGLRKKVPQASPSLPSLNTNAEKSSEVNNNTEEQGNEISEDQTLSAACVLVCEWANKLLGRVFSTLIELARFLVGGSYVSTKSMAAFVVMSATESKIQKMNSKLTFSPCLSQKDNGRSQQTDNHHVPYANCSPAKGRPVPVTAPPPSRTPTPQESQIVPKTPSSMRKEQRAQHQPVVDNNTKQAEQLMSPPPIVPSRLLVSPYSSPVVSLDVSTTNLSSRPSTPGKTGKPKLNGVLDPVYMKPGTDRSIANDTVVAAPCQISASPVKQTASFHQTVGQQLQSPQRHQVQSPQRHQVQSPQKHVKTQFSHAQTRHVPSGSTQTSQLSHPQQYSTHTLADVTATASHTMQQQQHSKKAPSTPTHRQTHVTRTPPIRRSESCPYPPVSLRTTGQEGTGQGLLQSPVYAVQGHAQTSSQQLAPSQHLTPRRHASWPAESEATPGTPHASYSNSVHKDVEISTPYRPPPIQRCHSVPAPPPSSAPHCFQSSSVTPGPRVIYSPARLNSPFDQRREIRSKVFQAETSRVRRNLTAVLDNNPATGVKTEASHSPFPRNNTNNVDSLMDVPFSLETEFSGHPSELNDLDGLDDVETVELLKSLETGEHIWGNEWPTASLPLMETS